MGKSKFVFASALLALVILFAGIYRLDLDPADLDVGRGQLRVHETVGDSPVENPMPSTVEMKDAADKYVELPIHFEPNVGQADETVKYLARGSGYALLLKENEAIVTLQSTKGSNQASTSVWMQIESDNPSPTIAGNDIATSVTNYLIGNDPALWHTGVPNYGRVHYKDVLPGIDAVYYGNGRQLEYDFVVSPGSDPKQIKVNIGGPKSIVIDRQSGDLVMKTDAGNVRQLKPIAYQENNGERIEIAANYRLERNQSAYSISFDLAEYDHSKELIIDPILSYGSYLGGLGFDEGRGIAVDEAGNAFVVGTSASPNFPVTAGTIKPSNPPSTNNVQWNDAFVTKISPDGTAILWSTYYGGRNGSEIGIGAAVTSSGEVLISGTTTATDLPVVNAYQSTFGGTDDAFAAKLNSTGSAIIYSTYLGGNNTDTGGRIALNKTTGDTVFAGSASSPNFPTTPGAYEQKLCNSPATCSGIFYSGSYAVKLTASGNAVYSTLFDAAINDVTLDAADNAVIGGSVGGTSFPTTAGAFQPASSGGVEGFIAKLNPAGSSVVYGTYLGGGLQSDRVNGIAVDSAGNMYVTGQTQNPAFPVTAGSFDETYNGGEDGFVTKLNPSGSALVYSTFFGGQGKDQPFAIGIASDNSPIIAGETFSGTTFPVRNSIVGNTGSIFVTRFNPTASSLVYSTLLGVGGAYSISVDNADNAYVTGHTTNIVVTPNSFQPRRGATDSSSSSSSSKDAFVLKLATGNEDAVSYAISGSVTDTNYGFNNDYSPIVVTISGTVNRSYSPPTSGGGTVSYFFGNLPQGGNYTITAKKVGYDTDPENVTFNALAANQSADFQILRNRAPTGSITTPTHGASFNAPASITIQATASDPDGDAIQKVDFVAYNSTVGSVPLGTDTTAPYEFTWNTSVVGTWALYAIPTDSKGLRGTSVTTVQVSVVNPAPVSVSFLDPIEGASYVEGDYIPVRVAVSPSVNFVQVRDQNGELVAWLPQSPWSSTWRPMIVGNYTLTATAQNSQGQTATSPPLNVTVGRINHRITGTILDSVTNGPVAGVTLDLVSPSTPTITAQTTTDASGNYLFTDLGTTPNDGITITPTLAGYRFDPLNRSTGFLGYIKNWTNQNFTAIRATGITVNMTSPSDGQIFTAPASFTLAANATTTAGTITKVEFYRDAVLPTLLGTDTTAPYELTQTGAAAGNYSYFARATDSTNGVTDSSGVNITVNPAPTTVQIHGEVRNPGGGPMVGIVVRLTGTANGNPVTQTWTTNVNGSYLFNVPFGGNYTVTPEGTNTTFTPPSASFVNVTQNIYDVFFIASAANQSPTVQINSPANGAAFTMPTAIPINVTASDADGTIAHLSVTAQSSTMSTVIGQANVGSLSFNWQPNLPGAYTLFAQALDNGGLRTTVSITITINPPPPVTISGRIVDRSSSGITGVDVVLRDWATGNTVFGSATTDASGNYSIPNVPTFSNYVLRALKDGYSFSPQQRIYFNISVAQTGADFTGTAQAQISDFDGDGASDLAVWRPSSGVWWTSRSQDGGYGAVAFGSGSLGDVVAPGNYDGDKKIDYATYRNGTWYILSSVTGAVKVKQFGSTGDQPVPADFDGDGRTDVAIFRPSASQFWIDQSTDGLKIVNFGLDGDIPSIGDFDGDGKADIAVWRPGSGIWFILQSTDGKIAATQFGSNGDIPMSGDFDGDKRTDIAVYRPANRVWYVYQSSDGSVRYSQFGIATDKPVPGDYDHDGKTDVAVFRESEGNWYIIRSSTGAYSVIRFGQAGDIPIPGAYLR